MLRCSRGFGHGRAAAAHGIWPKDARETPEATRRVSLDLRLIRKPGAYA